MKSDDLAVFFNFILDPCQVFVHPSENSGRIVIAYATFRPKIDHANHFELILSWGSDDERPPRITLRVQIKSVINIYGLTMMRD